MKKTSDETCDSKHKQPDLLHRHSHEHKPNNPQSLPLHPHFMPSAAEHNLEATQLSLKYPFEGKLIHSTFYFSPLILPS